MSIGAGVARAGNIDWASPSSGSWDTPSNWSPPTVPGSSDTARIVVAGTYTVTLDVDPTAARIVVGGTSGAQTLTGTNRALNDPDGVILGANGRLTLIGACSLGGLLDNAGILTVNASGTTTLTGGLTTQVGSQIRLGNNATLSLPGSFTNHGTIATNGSTSNAAALTLTSGATLTNASDGTLNTANGYLDVAANLDNQGAISTNYRLDLTRTTAIHTNTGSITNTNPNSFHGLAIAGATFHHNGGSIAGPGYVTLTGGATFDGNGGGYGTPGKLSFNASTGSFASVLPPFDMTFTAGSTLSGGALTTAADITLTNSTANATSLVNAAGKTFTLTATCPVSSPFDNAGILTLTASAAATLSGGLTTQVGSQIKLGNSATLSLPGNLTNHGTIATNGSTSNAAVLTLPIGSTLINASDGTLNTTVGYLDVAANLDNQGTISTNHRLDLTRTTATHTNIGSITNTNPNSVHGLAIAGATLHHNAGTIAGPGYVTLTSGATFDGSGGGYGTPGKLSFNASTGSFGSILPPFDMTFTAGSTLSGGALTTGGDITLTNSIANVTSLLNATGKTFTLTGTSSVSSPFDNAGILALTASAAPTLSGGLTTQVGSQIKLGNNATLSLPGNLTNHGTIATNGSTSNAAALTLPTGSTLINASDGTLNTANGYLDVAANLDNQGTISTNYRLDLTRTTATHTNIGSITNTNPNSVHGLAIAGATFHHNGGSIAGPGYVTLTGGATFDGNGGGYGTPGKLSFNASTGSFASVLPPFDMTFTAGSTLTGGALTAAGDVTLTNSTATVTSLANPVGKTLTLTGTSLVSGALSNAGTVTVSGGANATLSGAVTTAGGSSIEFGANSTLTVANGFLQNGSLVSQGTTGNQVLNITAGTLEISSTGSIVTTGGYLTINAEVWNHGTINTNYRLIWNQAGANHFNDGTIGLTNSSTIHTFQITGNFNQAGGSGSGTGSIELTNGNLNGGNVTTINHMILRSSTTSCTSLTNASGKTLQLAGTTVVSCPLHNAGIIETMANASTNAALNGLVTTDGGSSIDFGANSTLTVANGFIQKGALVSQGTTGNQVLNITAGTLEISSTGSIVTTGGYLTINAEVWNHGTINTNYRLIWNQAGANHFNDGTIGLTNSSTIHTFQITGNFNQAGGSGSGAGSIELTNGNLNGGNVTTINHMILRSSTTSCTSLTNASGKKLQLAGTTVVSCPLHNAGEIETLADASTNAALNGAVTTAGASSIDFGTNSTLTVANGFIQKGALTSQGTTGSQVLNITAGTLEISSTGSIVTTGGYLTINAEVWNHGTINTNYRLIWNQAGANHFNDGTIGLTNSSTIHTFQITGNFNQAGGSGSGAGSIELTNGNLNGGNVTTINHMILRSSTTSCTSLTNASGKKLQLAGTTVVSCPLHNAGEIETLADASTNAALNGAVTTAGASSIDFGTNSTLTVASGFIQNGALTSQGTTGSQVLNITAGTLEISSTGSIVTTGGYLTINAEVWNHGTINTNYRLIWNQAGANHLNDGTIGLTNGQPNHTFQITGNFNQAGGSGSGAGSIELTNGNLNGGNVTTINHMILRSSTTSCTSLTNASGKKLQLAGTTVVSCPLHNAGEIETLADASTNAALNGAVTTAGASSIDFGTNSTLTVASGFIQNGALTSQGTTGAQVLNVTTGTLEISSTGSIVTTGGYLTLNAQISNQGTIGTNYRLRFHKTGATHVNTGTISTNNSGAHSMVISAGNLLNAPAGTIKGSGELDVSAVTFTNNGTLAPGLSAGSLNLIGSDLHGPSSVLNIELGGRASSQYDLLAVTGTAALAGKLAITHITGFVPSLNDSFSIITAGSVTDTFRTITGRTTPNSLYYQVQYRPQRVVLIARNPEPNHTPTAYDDAVTAPEDGSADFDLLANDIDPDADLLYITGTTTPQHGTTQILFNGNLRYVPTPGYSGSDQFDYFIDDNRIPNNGRDTATVFVDVAPLNDPPVFDPPTPPDQFLYSVQTGDKVAFTIAAHDLDPTGIVTLSVGATPPGAALTPPLPLAAHAPSTAFSWTPGLGQAGLYTLLFSAADDSGTTITTRVRIQVTGAVMTCGPGHHWIDVCAAGTDDLSSGALIGLDLMSDGNLDSLTDASFVLGGPVQVRHENPGEVSARFPVGTVDSHLDVIDTEILSLSLTGGGIAVVAGQGLGMGGALPHSYGAIVETANDSLGASFFDVFFEVQAPGGPYYNQQPLRILNTIDRLPPGGSYEHPTGVVALYTSPTPGVGTPVANLVTARHILTAPQAVCGISHFVDHAAGGLDTPPSEADVGIDTMDDGNLDGLADVSFRLQGPVVVQRSNPLDVSVNFPTLGAADGHRDVIDTEILSMELTAADYTLRAGVGQNGLPRSIGTIVERAGDPTSANSFFDVFFEINSPAGPLYNQTPLRVESIIDCVPPHAQYLHPMGGTIPLYTAPTPGQGMHVANLVNARHSVGDPPPCDSPHWVDVAPAGFDSPESEADVGIDLPDDGNLDGQIDQSFRLQGPVTVRRSPARDSSAHFPIGASDGHRDVIDTEIVSMSLASGAFTLSVGEGRGQGGVLPASRGAIHEQSIDRKLADSFFDVFFEFMTPLGPAYNHDALRLSSIIDCVPPAASYLHPDTLIKLYSHPVGGEHIANLVTARHSVGPQANCPAPHWVDTAPPGLDSPSSEADVGIDLNLDNLVDQSLRLMGPLTVRRTGALDASANFPGYGAVDGHRDVIDTEILSMSLTAGGYRLEVGAGHGDGGVLPRSKGTIVEKAADNGLADSFFDVFFEITTPAQVRLYNLEPLRVESEIQCVPPVATYVHPTGVIPLYTSPYPGQGVHVANLVTAQHNVTGGPGTGVCLISGADSACVGQSREFFVSSNTTQSTIQWSLTGDGTFDGPTDQATVMVKATQPKSYTLTVTVSGAMLSATCSKTVLVNGCETATLLALFQATPLESGIELRWRLGDPARAADLRLERAEQAQGPWSTIAAERRSEADVTIVTDPAVETGRTYLYRLNLPGAEGGTQTFGPITVVAGQAITDFALGTVMPNPTNGEARVEFTVPRESNIQLYVVDVLGRKVATLASGSHRAGRYQAIWSGKLDGGRAPAGLYFVRYVTPVRTMVRRVAVVR